jgi:3' exoribonuclease, RNase T-like
MLYFFDTEFLDDGDRIDLISIGLVAEDGRELYACSLDAQLHRCHGNSHDGESDDWMLKNVMAKLPGYADPAWMYKRQIRTAVLDFMLASRGRGEWGSADPHPERPTIDGKKPEIWGYYSSYDWVAFCQLFGRMIDLPPQLPKFCRDLKQLSVDLGSPEHPPKPSGAHNALEDARWNKELYELLMAKKLEKESR